MKNTVMVPRLIRMIGALTSQFAPDIMKYLDMLPLKNGAPVMPRMAVTAAAPMSRFRLNTPRISRISLVPYP